MSSVSPLRAALAAFSVRQCLSIALAVLFLTSSLSAVAFFFTDLWRESFIVLLPDAAHPAVTTEVATSIGEGVCFTLHNLSQCADKYEIRDVTRWHFNASRDGWSLLSKTDFAFRPEPLFYPVLTDSSAATYYAVLWWHMWSASWLPATLLGLPVKLEL